jgi:uncharacterized membrane protein YjfL (UPF0719 family)
MVRQSGETTMDDLWQIARAYLITLGWAIVGSVSMGLGIIITIKLFTFSTRDVDEWAEIKKNNIGMAIILASLILALGIVVASVTRSH